MFWCSFAFYIQWAVLDLGWHGCWAARKTTKQQEDNPLTPKKNPAVPHTHNNIHDMRTKTCTKQTKNEAPKKRRKNNFIYYYLLKAYSPINHTGLAQGFSRFKSYASYIIINIKSI